MVSLHKIMKHINKFKYTDDIFNYMDNNIDDININSIFNKSEEQLQIDFIKLLLSKIKEDIKFVLVLTISNINTFKTLLEWSIKYDDYNLCYFLFHHKDKNIILTNKDYTLYEEKTKNKKIALLINEFKLKDSYDDSSDDSSDDSTDSSYDSSDDSTDSSDFFDSSDSSDFDSDHSDVD
jgi:hypothetical protein